MRFFLKILFYFLLFLVAIFIVLNIITAPSNDREWNTDQAILPYAEIDNNLVSIHNIRNFSYTSTTEYTPSYYDKTFDLDKLVRVWFLVEPLPSIKGAAHTLLSFEFEDNEFVAISVEIRKEKEESYNPIKGLFNHYELMYVIANERDIVKLRSNYRKDQVYLYPGKTTPEKARVLFLEMVGRANELREKPEFYNTVTSTCTTNIVSHINTISPKRIPWWDLRILFPENADTLALELGLIDTDLPLEEARMKYNINSRAEKYADDPEFSKKIRE